MKTNFATVFCSSCLIGMVACTIHNPISPKTIQGLVVDTFQVSINLVPQYDTSWAVLPYAEYLLSFHFEKCAGKVQTYAVSYGQSGLWSVDTISQLISEGKSVRWKWGFWGADPLVGVDSVRVFLDMMGSLWEKRGVNITYLEDFALRDSAIAHIQR